MKQFLRETWELGYWALFCPAKLQERMNAWAPQPKQGEYQPDTTYLYIMIQSPDHRFQSQVGLLILLLSLPLSITAASTERLLDWLFVVSALLTSYVVASFSLLLGLLLPLLFTLIYLARPELPSQTMVAAAGLLPPLSHIGLGFGVGMLALLVSTLAVYRLTQHSPARLRQVMIACIAMFSVAGGTWLASDSWPVALVTGGLVALVLLSVAVPASRSEDTITDPGGVVGVVAILVASFFAGFVVNVVTGGVAGPVAASVAGSMAGIVTGLVAIGITGGGRGRGRGVGASLVTGLVPGGLAVGLAVGFAVGLSGLAILPLLLLLIASWLVGFSLAQAKYSSPGLSAAAILVAIGWEHQSWLVLPAVLAVMIGYYRLLPDYLILAGLSGWYTVGLSRLPAEVSLRLLRGLPPYIDELIWLPLPGHSRILAAAFQADPPAALATLQAMQTSPLPGFRRTIRQALPDIVAGQLRAVDSPTTLIASVSEAHPILPLLLPALYNPQSSVSAPLESQEVTTAIPQPANQVDAEIAELLPRLQAVARDVAAALEASSPFLRERRLENCLATLKLLQGQLPGLGLPAAALPRWRPVLERWQAVLQDEIIRQRPESQEEIINPFQSGNPLGRNSTYLFKGRDRFADAIVRQILDRGRPTLVLYGPRRCGKTSFVLNMSRRLPSTILPVFVNLQNGSMTTTEANFCYGLVRALSRDLRSQGHLVPPAQRSDFRADPYGALEDWLDQALEVPALERILICLDEFETLGEALAKGQVSTTLFHTLRHLIQHSEKLGFLLCGVQTLDEMGPGWSNYFISVAPVEMVYLEPDEARQVLEDPDPDFKLRYDTGVVDAALHETRCHPYLLQLLGEAMVKEANARHTLLLTTPLLQTALDRALSDGTPYFTNLWKESTGATPAEQTAGQMLLHSVAHDQAFPAPTDASTQATQRRALGRLQRYHVLERVDGGYRFEVPLIARWVRERAVLD